LFEGGQANLNVYVGNDPVNWYDPSGRDRTSAVAFGALAGADVGFTAGGGAGLVVGVLGGGIPALGTTPAAALGGASVGALVGGLLGGAIYDATQSIGDLLGSIHLARKSDLKQVDELARRLGLPREAVTRQLHDIKKAAGLRGQSVDIDDEGNVFDPNSGDFLGNVCDR